MKMKNKLKNLVLILAATIISTIPFLNPTKEPTTTFPDTVIVDESEDSQSEQTQGDSSPFIDDDEMISLQ